VDIIPSLRPCNKQSIAIKNNRLERNSKFSRTIFSPNRIFLSKKDENSVEDDEDESNYHDQNQITNDVTCQMELLELESKEISSF
jgi:hypothetical protein